MKQLVIWWFNRSDKTLEAWFGCENMIINGKPTHAKEVFWHKNICFRCCWLDTSTKNITPFEWTFEYLNNRIWKHIIQFLDFPCNIFFHDQHCLFILYMIKQHILFSITTFRPYQNLCNMYETIRNAMPHLNLWHAWLINSFPSSVSSNFPLLGTLLKQSHDKRERMTSSYFCYIRCYHQRNVVR